MTIRDRGAGAGEADRIAVFIAPCRHDGEPPGDPCDVVDPTRPDVEHLIE